MRSIRAHCVPMALVAMAAWVCWLQDTLWQQLPSPDIAGTQLVGIDNVPACGTLALGIIQRLLFRRSCRTNRGVSAVPS